MPLLLALLLLAAIRQAQPLFHTATSIELRTAESKAIFRATVQSVYDRYVPKPGGAFGGYDESRKRRPDGHMHYSITLQVGEVIKGDVPKTMKVFTQTSASDKRFNQWAEAETEFLWFAGSGITTNMRAEHPMFGELSTIRLGPPVPAEGGYTSDFPIISAYTGIMTDKEKIIQTVHKWAKQLCPAKVEEVEFGRINGVITTLRVLACRNDRCSKSLGDVSCADSRAPEDTGSLLLERLADPVTLATGAPVR